MPVNKAGNSSSTYLSRIDPQLRCICEARGDRAVFVDGQGPYCIIIDREGGKVDFDDVSVTSSKIEAIWLESDCIPIKKKSVLVSGGKQYKARNDPMVLHDGWVSVQLQLTCAC